MLLSLLSCVAWVVVRTYPALKFESRVGSHLEVVAGASNREVAIRELSTALDNMSELCPELDLDPQFQGCTTSIIRESVEDSIALWKANLRHTLKTLQEVPEVQPESSSSLWINQAVSAVLLMRGQGILISSKGDVKTPAAISVYPYHKAIFWWGFITWVLFVLLGTVQIMRLDG